MSERRPIPVDHPDMSVFEMEEHGKRFLRVFSDHDCIDLDARQALQLGEILKDFAVRCAQ